MPQLSVIILSYNTVELLRRCLDDWFISSAYLNTETIVVDNGSMDGSVAFLRQLDHPVRLIVNESNRGFAGANNQALQVAGGEIALLLNSDAFINRDVIDRALATFAERPEVGIVGVRIDNPDGTFQAGRGTFPGLWDDIATSLGFDQLARSRARGVSNAGPTDWVHGACLFVRKQAFEEIGGLDEQFFMYSEELEWCYRCRQSGWAVWYLPDVSVVHLGGGSSRNMELNRRAALYTSRLRYRRMVSGRASAWLLWLAMIAGLALRIPIRYLASAVLRRGVGLQTPANDWKLLRALSRASPTPGSTAF